MGPPSRNPSRLAGVLVKSAVGFAIAAEVLLPPGVIAFALLRAHPPDDATWRQAVMFDLAFPLCKAVILAVADGLVVLAVRVGGMTSADFWRQRQAQLGLVGLANLEFVFTNASIVVLRWIGS